MTQILPIRPSESKIPLSVKSYDEKTAENDRNCYISCSHISNFPRNNPSKSVTVGLVHRFK